MAKDIIRIIQFNQTIPTLVLDLETSSMFCYLISQEWLFKWVLKLPAWVALVEFVSFFFFKILLKLSSWTDAESHCLHLNNLSPDGVFRRFLKSPARTDAKSDWLHLYAFSHEWVFKCVLKLPACTYALVTFSNVSSNWLPVRIHWLGNTEFMNKLF